MLSFFKNILQGFIRYSNDYNEYKLKQLQKTGYHGWY